MRKPWPLAAAVILLAGLLAAPAVLAADPAAAFRQQNGLVAYNPPDWFLQGYFMAREKSPAYLFGPVQAFVKALGAKTTWLIEDLELARAAKPTRQGKMPEYTVYLEAVYPRGVEYWVFIVMPHQSAQDWYAARRVFHGSKTQPYYGQTESNLEVALRQGMKVKGELRFFIVKGEPSLQAPAELITSRFKIQPVYDLKAGRRLNAAASGK
jgi:hypothetical protein